MLDKLLNWQINGAETTIEEFQKYDKETRREIAIDCGVSWPGGRLGCLRLEDMAEFYV